MKIGAAKFVGPAHATASPMTCGTHTQHCHLISQFPNGVSVYFTFAVFAATPMNG